MPVPTDDDLNHVALAALVQAAAEGERNEAGDLTPEAEQHVRAVAELCSDREQLLALWSEGDGADAGETLQGGGGEVAGVTGGDLAPGPGEGAQP